MAPRKNTQEQGFGETLAQLRKEAGYAQREPANEIGVSRCMVVDDQD